MVVIKQSTLFSMSDHQKVPNQFRVSLLQKYLQPSNSGKGMVTLLPFSASFDKQTSTNFQGNNLLGHLIFDSEVSLSNSGLFWHLKI